MVSKNTGPGSRTSSGKKPVERPSRRTKKPVTIDLEATAKKASPVAAKSTDSSVKPNTDQTVKTVPGIGKKAGVKSNTAPAETPKEPGSKSASSSARERKEEKKTTPSAKGPDLQNDGPKSAAKKSVSSARPTEPKDVAKPKKAGVLGKIVAGFIGGSVALGGAYILQLNGIIPIANKGDAALSENVTRLQSQMSTLSAKIDGASKPDFEPIEKRIGQLEMLEKQRVQNASKSSEAEKARDKRNAALAQSLKQLEDANAKLQQSISSGAAGENAGLSALSKRITSLEDAGKNTGKLDAVTVKIEALAGKLAALSTTILSGKDDANKETTAKITSVGKQLARIEEQFSSELAKTGENLVNVETGMKAIGEKLAALGLRFDALETSVNTPRKDEHRVARAMAVAGLKSAIDSGGGFSEALGLFEGLSNDPQSVASLKEYAEIGIPDVSSIATSFSRLSDKIVQTGAPKSDGSVVGRFLNNARSLVKVKTIGVIAGDSPQAIVSRIEAALKTGDLEAVQREWATLPDAAKEISTDWINKVKARSGANSLITNLLKQFMTGTTGTNN